MVAVFFKDAPTTGQSGSGILPGLGLTPPYQNMINKLCRAIMGDGFVDACHFRRRHGFWCKGDAVFGFFPSTAYLCFVNFLLSDQLLQSA